MCEKCFDKEYFEFKDERIFMDFDRELERKVANGNIKDLGYWSGNLGKPFFKIFGIWIGTKEKWIPGYYRYECNFCGQKWKYSYAENADRGYFKKDDRINFD